MTGRHHRTRHWSHTVIAHMPVLASSAAFGALLTTGIWPLYLSAGALMLIAVGWWMRMAAQPERQLVKRFLAECHHNEEAVCDDQNPAG